jgi:transposase-like protein
MKIKKEEGIQTTRQKYTVQFKAQVLECAARDGVPKTALDLGIAESMLYSWRAKSRQTGQSFEDQKLQQAEIARFKRETVRLEDEVAFLKKRPRTLQNSRSEVRDDQSE